MREELLCKSQNIRGQIQSVMGLGAPREITLNIEPSGAGEIHLNTLNISDSTWSGFYFEDVDIDLMANAKPGYQFSHWGLNNVIEDTLSAFWNGLVSEDNLVFTAYFEEDTTLVNPVSNIDFASVQLYPNPSSDVIHIVSKSASNNAQIFNAYGQEIITKNFLGNITTLNISDLSNGLYIAVITDRRSGSINTLNFIKK
jgi:hypothetical protein